MRTAEIKSNEEWSSLLWTQFMQLRKKPEKKPGLQRDLNPWPRDTGAMLWSHWCWELLKNVFICSRERDVQGRGTREHMDTYWSTKNISGFIIGVRAIFCRGWGGGNPFAQKILASCPSFYKTVERKLGPCNKIGRTGIRKWLDKVFQSQYLPSLSINFVATNKHLEKNCHHSCIR